MQTLSATNTPGKAKILNQLSPQRLGLIELFYPLIAELVRRALGLKDHVIYLTMQPLGPDGKSDVKELGNSKVIVNILALLEDPKGTLKRLEELLPANTSDQNLKKRKDENARRLLNNVLDFLSDFRPNSALREKNLEIIAACFLFILGADKDSVILAIKLLKEYKRRKTIGKNGFSDVQALEEALAIKDPNNFNVAEWLKNAFHKYQGILEGFEFGNNFPPAMFKLAFLMLYSYEKIITSQNKSSGDAKEELLRLYPFMSEEFKIPIFLIFLLQYYRYQFNYNQSFSSSDSLKLGTLLSCERYWEQLILSQLAPTIYSRLSELMPDEGLGRMIIEEYLTKILHILSGDERVKSVIIGVKSGFSILTKIISKNPSASLEDLLENLLTNNPDTLRIGIELSEKCTKEDAKSIVNKIYSQVIAIMQPSSFEVDFDNKFGIQIQFVPRRGESEAGDLGLEIDLGVEIMVYGCLLHNPFSIGKIRFVRSGRQVDTQLGIYGSGYYQLNPYSHPVKVLLSKLSLSWLLENPNQDVHKLTKTMQEYLSGLEVPYL